MPAVTYFAVLPFARNADGELCPGPAIECPNAATAETRARVLAPDQAGAVAFSRTGDPDTGEWADAVILARVGETPEDLEAVSGA